MYFKGHMKSLHENITFAFMKPQNDLAKQWHLFQHSLQSLEKYINENDICSNMDNMQVNTPKTQ